jgi:hypothetical protein
MGLEDRFNAGDNPSDDNLPSHQFSYAMREYARGKMTRAEVLAAVNAWLEGPLTAQEQTDSGLIADLIDGAGSSANKMMKAVEIGDVMGLAEMGAPGYQTRAELKAKIGF